MSRPHRETAQVAMSDRGRAIGLAAIVLVASFLTIWMFTKGRAALAEQTSAPILDRIEPSRFSANPWSLPDDAMLGFIEIPAGTFLMGSDPAIDPAAYENERWSATERRGEIDLPRYFIGRYEVTIAQFAAFVADTHRKVDAQALRGHGDRPVTNVTWADAIAYARRLEQRLRTSPQTPATLKSLLESGWRIMLPSEAQWEKAARGADGRIYPWGSVPDPEKANFGRSGTTPVGSFECADCAFGLADMSGNVWELTRSFFQPYPWTPDETPRDLHAPALFVMRGGSYSDGPNNVRAAVRGGIDPGARRAFIGFRLVLELPP